MDVATSILHDVHCRGYCTGQYFVCTLSEGLGQIMYFFVNAYPPEPFDVATLQVHNFMSHDVEGTGQHFV